MNPHLAVLESHLEQLRNLLPPDPRTARFYADTLGPLKATVYGLKPDLSKAAWTEVKEAWGYYSDVSAEDFQAAANLPGTGRDRPYIEELLIIYLTDLLAPARESLAS